MLLASETERNRLKIESRARARRRLRQVEDRIQQKYGFTGSIETSEQLELSFELDQALNELEDATDAPESGELAK